ncbi:MAG: hypothetical protein KBH11_02130 [Bacteroidia bacterium]|nr:hypothetical protein [Bacteroidota bacterium]MBK9046859.1 hypothetical protein [Bacteroidota bacterium]MBK9422549.1 hypothetical protein [Bacteroidota bacterium]MBP9081844.1 hypothetical protein [Bacteroidia bacterium]
MVKLKFSGILLILIIYFVILHTPSIAQVNDSLYDELDAPVDTAYFYKKLYNYSKNRKAAYFLYKSVFNPPKWVNATKKTKKKSKNDPLRKFENKIIRKIEVISLDPTGTSISDTSRHPHSVLQKTVNKIHIESRRRTILNYVLIKRNDSLDILLLKESERLLRSTGFIRDVRMELRAVSGTRDSVDIYIYSQDYWSIRPDIVASTSRVKYSVNDRNFLGFGHLFDLKVTDLLKESSPPILDGSYTVPSLGTSYVSPKFYYGTSEENNIRGIVINRPFYSPLTQWAGGLDLYSRVYTDSIRFTSDTIIKYFYRSFTTDFWAGYSANLRKGITVEERSTRLVSAVRFSRTRYPKVTPGTDQLKELFSGGELYLASLSFSARKYVTDKYIFKFGDVEDVPDGRKLTLTSGVEKRFTGSRFYVGIAGALGSYFENIGYLYSGIGFGAFVQNDKKTIGLIRTEFIYFSPLLKMNRWYLRNFIETRFIYGVNRASNEFLYLNTDDGIPGYREEIPKGSSRLTLTFQSVLFSPVEFLGFRFAPIVLAGYGLIGDYNQTVFGSKLYQTYGLGLLIKNELLVLNTFQITFAIYPILPQGGIDYRFNPVKLSEDRFRDFDISRPGIEPFQ